VINRRWAVERRRTRYPGIYEYTARGGRRRYQVVFRTSRTVDATQRAASFDTLRDARDYQISQNHSVREGTYFDPKKGEITLTEFFQEFMRLAGPEEPKTRTNYDANFRNHIEPVLGSRAIRNVDAEAVAELLATIRAKRRRSRGDGKATVRQVHALVRRIFNVAMKLGRLPRYFPNPAAAIGVPNPEPRGLRPLDAWEVESIARAIRPMYRPLVYLMAYWAYGSAKRPPCNGSTSTWTVGGSTSGGPTRRTAASSTSERRRTTTFGTCSCFPSSWTRCGSIGGRSRR
jgi:hypothetical protein